MNKRQKNGVGESGRFYLCMCTRETITTFFQDYSPSLLPLTTTTYLHDISITLLVAQKWDSRRREMTGERKGPLLIFLHPWCIPTSTPTTITITAASTAATYPPARINRMIMMRVTTTLVGKCTPTWITKSSRCNHHPREGRRRRCLGTRTSVLLPTTESITTTTTTRTERAYRRGYASPPSRSLGDWHTPRSRDSIPNTL